MMWQVEEVKDRVEVEGGKFYPLEAVVKLLAVNSAEVRSVMVSSAERKKTVGGIASSRHSRACRRSRRDSSPWQHLRTGRGYWMDSSDLHTDPTVAFRTARAGYV